MDKSIRELAVELHAEALKQGIDIDSISFQKITDVRGQTVAIHAVDIDAKAV